MIARFNQAEGIIKTWLSHQTSDDGNRAGVASLGFESITSWQVPSDGDISAHIFLGIDLDISGTDSMHSNLDEVRKSKSVRINVCAQAYNKLLQIPTSFTVCNFVITGFTHIYTDNVLKWYFTVMSNYYFPPHIILIY